LYGTHHSVAFTKGIDVELLEVIELKVDQDGTRDVMNHKLFHDGWFKSGLSHPVSNLSSRPISDSGLVKLCHGIVKSIYRFGWSFGFVHGRHSKKDIIRIVQEVRCGTEQVWSLRAKDGLVVKVEFKAPVPGGVETSSRLESVDWLSLSSNMPSSLSVSKISVASDMGRGTYVRRPRNDNVLGFWLISTGCNCNLCVCCDHSILET
jgi:hypothetical protein